MIPSHRTKIPDLTCQVQWSQKDFFQQGTSLEIFPMQGSSIQFLVRKLRSHMSHGIAKIIKIKRCHLKNKIHSEDEIKFVTKKVNDPKGKEEKP